MELDNSNVNNSNSSNNSKKTRNKPTKAQIYKEERTVIILELEKLMGLNVKNGGVLLHDLEHNIELRAYLKENVMNIKKYYKCGTWNYFVNQHTKEGEALSEISLLRAIFKDENYEIISRKKIKLIDGIKKHMTNLIFLKL
jgi:hypothetical protein